MATIEEKGWVVLLKPRWRSDWRVIGLSLSGTRAGAIEKYLRCFAPYSPHWSWRNRRRRGEVKAVRVRIVAEVPE